MVARKVWQLCGQTQRLALAAGLALAGGSGCSSENSPTDPDAVAIGLLLPFTGSTSATASNFERAVLFAAQRINQAGGVHGHPVRVVSSDTHSDPIRSLAAVEKLVQEGAVVVVGPESAESAMVVGPALASHDVVLLSPLVGAADDKAVDCAHPWIRLAPSSRALGEAIAKLVSSESIASTAVIYAADPYNEALGQSAASRFTSLGGTVALSLSVAPDAQSYASVVAQVQAAVAQSIVLATSPRAAALFVNDYGAAGGARPRWFLSPLLKTDLLIENVAPGALEGALGVAPKIYDETTAFPDAFSQRWQGDRPLEGAYFYYDAMGLLAFALQKTVPDANGRLGGAAFQTAIRDAAAPPGEANGWNEIDVGLERLRQGSDIYYSGLTGPMLLGSCGARQLGVTSSWRVQSGTISDYQ